MSEKRERESMDTAEENARKLRALFPNVVTEVTVAGKTTLRIDFDALKREISAECIDDNRERYELTWPGKRKAKSLANAPVSATLCPNMQKSVDFDNTQNVYIEGDNLDVLKILRESHLEKVKMIYIDPPYNTGKGFVYNDDFSLSVGEYAKRSGQCDKGCEKESKGYIAVGESNGRFHTDWLNMMYPRLKVAKDLLTNDGIILINMDENEITNLQKLCEEIFGEENDLGTIVWDKRNPKGDARGVSQQHEYILLYAKNKVEFFKSCKMTRPKANAQAMIQKAQSLYKKISHGYTLENANADFQKWLSQQSGISGGERAYCKIDKQGEVYRAVSMAWPNKKTPPNDYFIPLIHPVTLKPCVLPARGWRNSSKTMKRLLENGEILFGKDERTQPTRKYLLRENMYEKIPSLLYNGGSDTELLKELGIPFETPKMVAIVKSHIRSFTNDNDIILDFFSGSATTAHAVMESNAEDGGKRKFIMVQLPERCDKKSEAFKAGYETICEIGEERIRRAGEKIKREYPASQADLGFRVFTLSTSEIKI